MLILCNNGFLKFYPQYSRDLIDYKRLTGIELVRAGDFFTFPFLAELETYSIEKLPYANLTASKTYAGLVEDVFNENGFVYDIKNKKLSLFSGIIEQAKLYKNDVYYTRSIIQAGSFFDSKKIKSFEAFFDSDLNVYRIERFEYE